MPIDTFEKLELMMLKLVERIEELDDKLFEQTQKCSMHSEQNTKLQAIGNSINSCHVLYSYIDSYEESKKTQWDFLKLKNSARKLIKVTIDIERLLKVEQPHMVNIYS